jgi:hypothetical protein
MIYKNAEQWLLKFPNGARQDLADTVVHAIIRHFGKAKLVRPKSYY